MLDLIITNENGTTFIPIVEEGVEWTTERRGTPGKLTFRVLKDETLGNIGGFGEGSVVRLTKDGASLFFGFVFTKKRDNSGWISCTAYDQIRYLKNKDTYVYENKTADALLRMIAEDYGLQLGTIEPTSYIIPTRTEENTSLLDMIETALDLELTNKGELYVLYDDFGHLTLRNIGNMRLDLLIDADTSESIDYTSTIDEQTYNQIKLTYDNEDTGKREVYMTKDSSNINKWGILQYFDTLSEGENGKAKADALLKLYNSKTRRLKVNNVLGDIRVRAGTLLPVSLDLGDLVVNSYMVVEKVVHRFSESEHFMDLTLRGGEFIA